MVTAETCGYMFQETNQRCRLLPWEHIHEMTGKCRSGQYERHHEYVPDQEHVHVYRCDCGAEPVR